MKYYDDREFENFLSAKSSAYEKKSQAENYEEKGKYQLARQWYLWAAQAYNDAKHELSSSGYGRYIRECEIEHEYCMKMVDRMNDILYGVRY